LDAETVAVETVASSNDDLDSGMTSSETGESGIRTKKESTFSEQKDDVPVCYWFASTQL